MIEMWNVTKQYSPRGGESQNVNLLPHDIFQAVWSMLVRHMQYCTFAMWMAMQRHQPLCCVCNIFSVSAGRLVFPAIGVCYVRVCALFETLLENDYS